MANRIKLKKADWQHLDIIADIHKSAYSKDHFSSKFSKKMLIEYYGELIKINEFCYSARNENNEIIGFIIAGKKTGEAIRRFSQVRFFSLIWYSILTPSELVTKAKGYLEGFYARKPLKTKSVNKLRLLSIATGKKYQSLGYGAEMLARFEDELRLVGAVEYGLSVRYKNHRAVKFYQKNGFLKEKITKKNIYFIKKIQIKWLIS
jgi:ribosomal protein S18 acetylase RimI-like enzyme